jgi:hypothetical protein
LVIAAFAATALVVWAGDPPKKTKKDSQDPKSEVATLEDFYGASGARFQAAFGFRTFQPTPVATQAPNSYGVAVDDMVISWKETRLDADVHDCAGNGECADIEVKSTLSYESTSLIEITVIDKSPYDAVNPKNDCNGDGDYLDVVDDQDCNDNGTLDVTVKVFSDAEIAGEIAVLDRVQPGGPTYKGRIPYSVIYDSPGTVFVQLIGTANAVITAQYDDRNDGTGVRCKNALDPSQVGLLTATTTFAVTGGHIDLKGYSIRLAGIAPTNGDNDGFADAQETIDMTITVLNKTGLNLDDLTASLASNDPNIECISTPVVTVPAVPATVPVGGQATSGAFRFKVANVNRTSADEVLQATFAVTIRSKQFDMLTRTMTITTALDLNSTAPGGTNPFVEDFEGAGFGKFTLQTLDAGKNSLVLSDGMRCQYSDPDGLNSNSPGRVDCFLGFATDTTAGVNDWHVHTGIAAQGGVGRAYTGARSVHWGVHNSNGTAKRDTGRMKQLDAITTFNAINMPLAGANPELVFAHQVALVDNRGIGGIDWGEVADRAIVQANVHTANGLPGPTWIKLQPYENVYEQQATDDFTNCMFDPTDDGTNEDSFFNPSDPARRLGPSSTCFPEFVFSRSGDTDYRFGFDPARIGMADPGSGLQGSVNVGTWVRPRFSLLGYSGRRIRLRFLGASIELGTGQTWDSAFFNRDDVVTDDGWYIDTIRIDAALGLPLTLSVDTKNITPLGTCGACTAVNAALTSTASAGPGQLVTLSAKTSTIDICVDGLPQYQFWLDGNGNSVVGDAGDTMLRDFTDNTTFIDAPSVTTRYGVRVRCSSSPQCDTGDGSNAATSLVTVNCPSTGTAKSVFTQSIRVNKAGLAGVEPDAGATVSWGATAIVDAIRGNLAALRASGGNFTGTLLACPANDLSGVSIPGDAIDPGPGGGLYYLLRPSASAYCNATIGYGSGAVKEAPGRDVEIAADANACP